MAAYTYGSSYESLMKKNCGYRSLGTYYKNLFDNVTSDTDISQKDTKEKVIFVPEFGGVPYVNENYQSAITSKDTIPGVKCDTWRRGQCCDGRALSQNAYTNCPDGLCPGYSALGSNTSYQSRY